MRDWFMAGLSLLIVAAAVSNEAAAQGGCGFRSGPTDSSCPMSADMNICKSYREMGGRFMSVPMPAQDKISACTRLVDSNRFKGEELAELLSTRASAYDTYSVRDLARALADHDRAIALSPRQASYYLGRSTTLCLHQQYERCVQDKTKYIELIPEPRDKAFGTFWRAEAHRQWGRREQAIADYRTYLAFVARGQGAAPKYEHDSKNALRALGATP